MKDTLLLIDANSLIHRAFHALPPLTTTDGAPAGALYGLASIIIKVLKERSYGYCAAAFDHPEKTEREKSYGAYKATRPPTADSLISQLQESHNLLKRFGIRVLEHPGWEADDIVATLAEQFANKDLQVIILSGDRDLLQCVKDGVVVEAPVRGISNTTIYNETAVKEKFGVPPKSLTDFKGLTGETSDNIPGVPGIGPKTAGELIGRYGTLEDLYKEIEELGLSNKKLEAKLKEHKDKAMLSKKLATLETGLPLGVTLEDLKIRQPFADAKLINYFQSLGFESLAKRVETS